MPFEHQGRRVIVGQRLTQGSPDIFLGWGRADERDFYVRQLSDLKGGPALEDLEKLVGLLWDVWLGPGAGTRQVGGRCAHCGVLRKSDVLDETISSFAKDYAKQTERDYNAFAKATRAGRIKAAVDAYIEVFVLATAGGRNYSHAPAVTRSSCEKIYGRIREPRKSSASHHRRKLNQTPSALEISPSVAFSASLT